MRIAIDLQPAALLLTALGLLLGVGVAGLRLSRALLPDLPGFSRATSVLVLAAALLVVPATVLGHAGLLAARPFLAVEALLVLASVFLPRPPARAPEEPPRGAAPTLQRIEAVLLTAAGGAALAFLLAYPLRVEPYAAPVKLDDPSYHLPAAAVWSRFHDLRMLKFDEGDHSTPFYPIGAELIDWALLAPLAGSDFLARWSQLPFALGSLLALAALARRLGLSRRSAALAGLLYLTVDRAFPILAYSAGNDHTTAFFTLAAADAALLFGAARTRGAAAYLGTAFGLLLGVKYIGLLFALPLLALLAAAALGRPRELRPVLVGLGLLGACALAAGGYTYLRNAWTTGNPVFPAPIHLAGVDLPGWPEATMAVRRRYPEFRIDLRRFLLLRTDYFGPFFRLTMLPAALLAPLATAFAGKGGRRERLVRTLLLSLPLLFFLQFLHLMPDHRDVRYVFPGIALAALAFVWLLARCEGIAPGLPPLAGSLLAAVVAWSFLDAGKEPRLEKLASAWGLLLMAGALVAAAPSLRGLLERRRAWGLAGAALLAVLGTLRLAGPFERYQREKLDLDPVARYLDDEGGRGGTAIAYVGGNRPYALFGSRLQNRVEIVPLSGPPADRFYTWGGSTAFPFEQGTYREWRANLRQLGIRYVALQTGDFQLPERPWMRRHPRDFERVLSWGGMEVWRFLHRYRDAPDSAPPGSPAPPGHTHRGEGG